MKMIIGLGNPGDQYNFTRHNLGFLVLDFYAKIESLQWERTEKRRAQYLEFAHASEKVVLVKPQTYYNDSGLAVREWRNYYKLENREILVICDDFNLGFGTLRWREKGADGGNNGLKSITKELGTMEYPRLRVGTGNDELRMRMGDVDFVLAKFTAEEKARLPDVLTGAVGRMREFLER